MLRVQTLAKDVLRYSQESRTCNNLDRLKALPDNRRAHEPNKHHAKNSGFQAF